MFVAVFSSPEGIVLQQLTDDGAVDGARQDVALESLAASVADLERQHPRWVWDDTARWYPPLLAAGVRVQRCVDLRLSHAILRNSSLTSGSALATAPLSSWDRGALERIERPAEHTLFDWDEAEEHDAEEDTLAEFSDQRAAIIGADDPARIGLLLAAESAGALVAAEMMHAGLPWREDIHNAILESHLGARPAPGQRPALLEAMLQRLRTELEAPSLNPDSPSELLKALAVAGLMVTSTRSWELKKLTHPAIEPLLEYKKMSRLLTANGWHWLDTNVRNGRFHPEYVPGGVVTGRWASTGGGGALQLPKQIRGAVVADPGWKFVVADASQLEPRILAALSGDRGMAEAGSAGDLYAGIVASGAVETRDEAKVAMLGAMYGATSGEGGRLMPRLARAYPRAIGLVEEAARAGERGEVVTTRLGRSSPPPGTAWRATQADAYGDTATEADASRARGQARSWGRFTRNFIVQGTAAEWALCWMANLRRALHDGAGDSWLTESPHLVFFMHDEVVVHTPADRVAVVEAAIRTAAEDAGRLLFGALPVTFPLTVAIVDDYGAAK
ncbi:bifunctional 3'-5' exonuclease/DNA polymerase [Glaciihabitans sp. INWT7]|uniref:bifunctional 3'-5' exonuclease/DNA polymerase n=1 Tax=Glaciihabitans sp. INWT7 TaxID=2596912 RepID=UPI001626E4CF|nr:bifunctional 3'-5' exonuclease/DNA polymerase [Glaciihabitans sp. INWT7]QNE46994.1 bifunctional 3'-5' exonuclease/DNA polymerase [Glaciihabitans sp. INWT7]